MTIQEKIVAQWDGITYTIENPKIETTTDFLARHPEITDKTEYGIRVFLINFKNEHSHNLEFMVSSKDDFLKHQQWIIEHNKIDALRELIKDGNLNAITNTVIDALKTYVEIANLENYLITDTYRNANTTMTKTDALTALTVFGIELMDKINHPDVEISEQYTHKTIDIEKSLHSYWPATSAKLKALITDDELLQTDGSIIKAIIKRLEI